ncbi:unnamed protein product, partial [Mesorhabditis belari]|uniref:Uncharacterized protein n=1 Tax=Mesorhabditis belari TaxID=2138241 RepID=A0AAF3ELS3_9BILA
MAPTYTWRAFESHKWVYDPTKLTYETTKETLTAMANTFWINIMAAYARPKAKPLSISVWSEKKKSLRFSVPKQQLMESPRVSASLEELFGCTIVRSEDFDYYAEGTTHTFRKVLIRLNKSSQLVVIEHVNDTNDIGSGENQINNDDISNFVYEIECDLLPKIRRCLKRKEIEAIEFNIWNGIVGDTAKSITRNRARRQAGYTISWQNVIAPVLNLVLHKINPLNFECFS